MSDTLHILKTGVKKHGFNFAKIGGTIGSILVLGIITALQNGDIGTLTKSHTESTNNLAILWTRYNQVDARLDDLTLRFESTNAYWHGFMDRDKQLTNQRK